MSMLGFLFFSGCNKFKKLKKFLFLCINFYWSIVYNVVFLLYSKGNQLYIYIYPLFFKILFPYRSLTEY